MEFPLPYNGVNKGLAVDKQPPATTSFMNNVRLLDVYERRARMGQRPGIEQRYTQQIGGAYQPIVEMLQVGVIE